MGDKQTLAMARQELEELYLGIPDESVNLTFQDLAEVSQQTSPKPKPNSPKKLEPIIETPSSSLTKHFSTPSPTHMHKLPSFEFSKSVRENDQNWNLNRKHGGDVERKDEFRRAVERSMVYDEASSVMSMSMASGFHREKAQRRRPGIPHTNICTICTTYIYIFRHRCLVCGRAYCRDCVNTGMGEMSEGRKCIQCLGKRFSQRYIRRAGSVGCCSRYPSRIKEAELKWAEKGPRRSGERAYHGGGGGHSSVMMSMRASPMTHHHNHNNNHSSGHNTPSFVSTSQYSPYLSPGHHLPF